MSIKISIKKNINNKDVKNYVLFSDENFNINGLRKYISNEEFSYITDLLKSSDLKKDILFFEINSKKIIYLVSIKKDLKTSDIENLGAKFHGFINFNKKDDYFLNLDSINYKNKNFAGYFLHGLKLKSYEFNIYKSKKEKKLISINVIGNKIRFQIKVN